MSNERAILDMDQAITLRVTVAVGKQHDRKVHVELTHEVIAPLFIVQNLEVQRVARLLRDRVMRIHFNDLREAQSLDKRKEELQDELDRLSDEAAL